MPSIGDIAVEVRRNLGVSEERLTDAQILNAHNIYAKEIVKGRELWFTTQKVEQLVTAGRYRISYPPGFRYAVKALLWVNSEPIGAPIELLVATIGEAKRVGAPTDGECTLLICDEEGFQLQDVPTVDVYIRITCQTFPEELTGKERTNYLTDEAPALLTHFLCYKCAPGCAGLMGEAQWHEGEYYKALAALEDEHTMRILSDVEVTGRTDGRRAGYARERGLRL